MAYPLSDEFNDRLGRWDARGPWTKSGRLEPWPSWATEFLDNSHVDVRSFRQATDLLPRPQDPDLDTVSQDPYLDLVFQTDLEVKQGDVFSENWTSAGTGINQVVPGYWDVTATYNSGDRVEYKGKHYVATGTTQGEAPDGAGAPWTLFFFVGKMEDYNGWHGLQVTADGNNIDCDFESYIDEQLDISTMDFLSIVFPDYSAVDAGTSTITLYSGAVSNPVASASVAWTGYLTGAELRIPMGDFAATNFDLERVCGVKIHLEDTTPPAADTVITIMAVRAVTSTWGVAAGQQTTWIGPLVHDTRWGLIANPVTLDGTFPEGTFPAFEPVTEVDLVRGDGTPNDPYPADAAATVYFYAGGETATREATGGNFNEVALVFRESQRAPDLTTGDGNTNPGSTPVNLAPDVAYAVKVTTTQEMRPLYAVWRIDGNGTGSGIAELRAAIYTDSGGDPGTLLTQSPKTEFVQDGAAAANVAFPLALYSNLANATDYWIVLHAGPNGDNCRVFADTSSGASRTVSDTFAGGTAATWDTGSDTPGDNLFTAWLPPDRGEYDDTRAFIDWGDGLLEFYITRRVRTTTPIAYTEKYGYYEEINTTGLDPGLYAFTAKLVGKTLEAKLDAVNRSRTVQNTIWSLAPQSDNELAYANGRMGFYALLLDRDAYVDAVVQAPVGYATLRTAVYETRDPVDGARLQAIYAPDADLFQELIGTDAFVDQTKTVSGKGGVRTRIGVQTNQFIADDWFETYLEAAIWVPGNVTRLNQPGISLDAAGTEYPLLLPALQPSQWNRLRLELRQFKDLVTGNPYSFLFKPPTDPDTPLGYFWVDAVKIGRRKVAWSVRAAKDAQFRRFYGLVNQPRGAVHFNPNERGRFLQLQAEALTSDAWVSEFTLFPHYAELGLPLYDQGFEKRL